MTSPLPGWYQDPTNPDQQKWWDGRMWSTYTMPLAAEASSGFGAPAAGDPTQDQLGPDTAAVPQAAPPFQAPAGWGHRDQGYRDATDPVDPAGATDYPGYQGYQQGQAGQPPAYPGYPGYQAYPGYGQQPLRSNPLALTGFILGIVSFVLFFIPFVGSVISLAAGAFSAIGLSNQSGRSPVYKVFGIIGLILGVIFTLLSVLILALVFSDPFSY